MRIETREDLAAALARLERHAPAVLAAFISSLAQDPGPVGEQVRTFIVGDHLAETIASLQGGDHHHSVASAFERAAGLIARAAQTLPADEVRVTLERLIAEDDYGTRLSLVAVVNALAATQGSAPDDRPRSV